MTVILEPEPDDPKPADLPCPSCGHPRSRHDWEYLISWEVCEVCRIEGGACEP